MAKPGAELASLGINMAKFCMEFNEKTKENKGEVFSVLITAYADKSFKFILKTTPVTNLVFKYAKLEKGSPQSSKNMVGKISIEDVKKIAEYKMPDLNTNSIDSCVKIILGTIKNMGIEVVYNKENAKGEI